MSDRASPIRHAAGETDPVPAHNLDAERAVLGAVLLEGASLAPTLLTALAETEFCVEHHRAVYRAIRRLHQAGRGIDLLTVTDDLRAADDLALAQGPAGLAYLIEEGSISALFGDYVAIVREHAAKRVLYELGARLVHAAQNGTPAAAIVAHAEGALAQIRDRGTGPAPPALATVPAGLFAKHGDEVQLAWDDLKVEMHFKDVHVGRGDLKAEVLVSYDSTRVYRGLVNLMSSRARAEVVKAISLTVTRPLPWGAMLEAATWQAYDAIRQGEPLATLTGTPTSTPLPVMPRMLYEGNPTAVYADGDTGKSLFATALALAVQSGTGLPCGLVPTRAAAVAYLDWETDQDTVEGRSAMLSAGLGIDPPGILYKRMGGPLVNEAKALAAEFSRRRVGLVIVDSMMFAVATGDGAAFHEPITAFYTALRLFAPAASLVLNHVTNADARSTGAGRPFGGAFAFNGPRLIYEARRDKEVTDATAIVFTCTKANNLPRRPEPFGLTFTPGADTITIRDFDLREAAPDAVAGGSMMMRLTIALAHGPRTVEALAAELDAKADSIRTTLQRGRTKKRFVTVPDTDPQQWGRASTRV